MYFNVNFNVFFKLIKVRFLVRKLYKNVVSFLLVHTVVMFHIDSALKFKCSTPVVKENAPD